MNIHEEDYPYSIYKRPEGDELLDAHNDIIAVFDPHTESEIEHLIAAAPEMKDRLKEAKECLIYLTPWWEDDLERIEGVIDSINALLRRIEGDDPE